MNGVYSPNRENKKIHETLHRIIGWGVSKVGKQGSLEHVEGNPLTLACKKMGFYLYLLIAFCRLLVWAGGTSGWYTMIHPYWCSLFPLEILQINCVWWRGRNESMVRPHPAVPTFAILTTSLKKILVSSLHHRSGTSGWYGHMPPYWCPLNSL
jgi:hypothetical protein